jgi:Flp pilus assembly pilin Flp
MTSRRDRPRQQGRHRGAAGRPTLRLRAIFADERGQDVIEYGLLSALFGIVCIVVWISIQGRLRDNYVGYDSGVQNIWASPDPGGS